MNKAVEAHLERLREVEWFANCGKPLSGDFVQVKSLKEAHKYYADPWGMGWENSKLAVMNRQGEILWELTHDVREEQQRAARETMKVLEQFFKENQARIFSRIPADNYLTRMVRLDLSWIAGEIEDQHVPELRKLMFFSTRLLPVYLSGHLPCGWSGKRIPRGWAGNSLDDLPEGKVIAF